MCDVFSGCIGHTQRIFAEGACGVKQAAIDKEYNVQSVINAFHEVIGIKILKAELNLFKYRLVPKNETNLYQLSRIFA